MKEKFRRFIHSNYTYLFVGICLALSGVSELMEDTFKDFLGFHLRLHHGVILMGLFQILNAISGIMSGQQYMMERPEDR
jgi:hypothetical protein